MRLEELKVYELSMEIGEEIYSLVNDWDTFQKWAFGMQLVKAVDSIAANISEGFGRFFYKENIQFQYYARGSMSETKTWLTKSKDRKVITEEQWETLMKKLDELGKRHNSYIKSIGKFHSSDEQ
jgi:four helix bundle protein